MSTYRVVARRSGDWWALEVPDLPGVFSQAKRLEKADEAAREAIAVMLDVEPDTISVTVEPQLSAEERAILREAAAARKARAEAEERERRIMQRAAATLTQHLSQRDAGRILGLSFQRVSQLLKDEPQVAMIEPRRAKGQSRRGKDEQQRKTRRSKVSV
ncbi:type II toxin-antitoxin system HicB family antitoxin [Streptomyces sp. MK5]|uniref:type II toxin-antitoxin system HicB family antitoxin n=1 Tax=Streptomyces sp. MK5 TaxID=3064253 RepID=UPI0027412126|nr:type II toxin-antitoxin system HicB family antitoxin [Streptomyces sp. MK5]